MSRFSYGVLKNNSPRKRMVFSVLFFIVLFLFFLYATGSLSSGNIERQKESLINALNKNIIYHYATYGCYPSSLEEIESLYGITYDKNSFFVDYDVRGANIMPSITILERASK